MDRYKLTDYVEIEAIGLIVGILAVFLITVTAF